VTDEIIGLGKQGADTYRLKNQFGQPTKDERVRQSIGWSGALTKLERLFEPRRTP
jgi:hypothetical protein